MSLIAGDLWEISVPDEWQHRQDPECYTMIPAPDSALQITAATKDGEITIEDMEDIAKERLKQVPRREDVTTGDFSGFTYCYYDGGFFCREWYVARGSVMLFVTYTCEHRLAEPADEAMMDVLETLRISRTASDTFQRAS